MAAPYWRLSSVSALILAGNGESEGGMEGDGEEEDGAEEGNGYTLPSRASCQITRRSHFPPTVAPSLGHGVGWGGTTGAALRPLHARTAAAAELSGGAVFRPREQHLALRSRAGAVPGHGARGVA